MNDPAMETNRTNTSKLAPRCSRRATTDVSSMSRLATAKPLAADSFRIETFSDGTIFEQELATGLMHSTLACGARISIDQLGRIISILLPDGRQRNFTYGSQGEIIAMASLDGSIWQTGDGLNWTCKEKAACWQGKVTIEADGTYCQKDYRTGRTRTTRLDGSIFVHAADGNLLKQEFVDGSIAECSYNRAGELTQRSVRHQDGTTSIFDRSGQITKIELASGRIIWFDREQSGELAQIRESSGLTWTRLGEKLFATANQKHQIRAELEVEKTGRYLFWLLKPASADFAAIACNPDGSISRLRSDGSESMRSMPDGSQLQFCQQGLIKVSVDASKVRRTFTYDNDQLAEIVSSDGSIWFRAKPGGWILAGMTNRYANEINLDRNGNLSVLLSNGASCLYRMEGTTFHFDQSKHLYKIERAGETQWHFKYGSSNELVEILNPNQEIWRKDGKFWRSNSRVVWHEQKTVDKLKYIERSADGTTRRYLEDGSVEIITLGSNYSRQFRESSGRTTIRNKQGQVVKIEEANGASKTFRYDALGKPIAGK